MTDAASAAPGTSIAARVVDEDAELGCKVSGMFEALRSRRQPPVQRRGELGDIGLQETVNIKPIWSEWCG